MYFEKLTPSVTVPAVIKIGLADERTVVSGKYVGDSTDPAAM
jgi:hypothetical protein